MFLEFSNPDNKGADNFLLKQLDPILENNSNELIAQTCDGAAVIHSHEGVVLSLKSKMLTMSIVILAK